MDKDKLKGMLKISERDKKLLIVVMAVLIMALAYFFGYSNLSSQVDTLSTKKANLEVTKKDLKEKNNNKQKYITDTDKLSKAYAILMDKYDSGSSQPNTIEFFNKTEDVTGAWVKSLALSHLYISLVRLLQVILTVQVHIHQIMLDIRHQLILLMKETMNNGSILLSI